MQLINLGLLILTLIFSACTQTSQDRPSIDNVKLASLYQADQTERTGAIEDWSIIAENDSKRRIRVLEMMDADSLVTANDYYHAAMILQHGSDSVAYKLAWDLAVIAVSLDSTHHSVVWLTAAAQDRFLLSIGKPQVYGTQFVVYSDVWYLQVLDQSAVSDTDRQRKGTRTLSEIEAFLSEKNGKDLGLNIMPDSILKTMHAL